MANQLPDFSYKGPDLLEMYKFKVQQQNYVQAKEDEKKNARIKQLQDVFTAGAGVVDQIQKKQQAEQIKLSQLALASHLGQAEDQVPTTEMKPAASTMVPQLSQAPVTQDYAKTPEYKARLAELATRVDPQESAKQALKLHYDQLNPNQTSSKGMFQQGGLETIGPDGRPMTMAVTFDSATGKYKDPMTGREITSEEQLKNLQKRGYAQSTRSLGFTVDGRPVVADARSGRPMVTDEQGNLKPYTDVVYQQLENVPAGMAEALGELGYSQEVLGRIANTFDPKFVGPIAARAGKISQFVGALTEEQRVEFYGNVAEYKNSIIKAITGAQMSEVEAARIVQQIPNENASPQAFLAGLNRAYKATQQRIKAKERALAKGGYTTRESYATPESIEAKIEERLKFLDNPQPSSSKPGKSDYSSMSDDDLIKKLLGQ